MVNLDVFTAPIEGENPSGSELRNDPRFLEVERLVEPASRTARSETPGEPPNPTPNVDWAEALRLCEDLAPAGRDLRLLVLVARLLANEGGIDPARGYLGFAGLAQGLDLIGRNLDAFWDSIHPVLREAVAPREAGLRRINALMQLENEDNGLLGDLKMNAVLAPRGLGLFTGDDLALASLTAADVLREGPSGLGAKEEAAIAAAHDERRHKVEAATRALAAEAPETFAALAGSLADARAALDAMATTLSNRLGLPKGEGVRFLALTKFLDRVRTTLDAARAHVAAESGAGEAPQAEPGTAAPEAAAPAAAPAAAAPRGGNGAISSREDVQRALDQIIAFYERTEPSSPIPHLARRMRRMVPMDFMELMEEIAPGGLKEFRSAAGVSEDKRK